MSRLSLRSLTAAWSVGWSALAGSSAAPSAPALVLPTPQQVAWQELELSALVCFGMNTFTERERGTGREDPALFNPADLNARQWVQALKGAGVGLVLLTAKHQDGFCLWPSRHTEYSVRQSPWREGRGDVVHEVARACREAGLRFGVHFAAFDRHEPAAANDVAYTQFVREQLGELLTDYGEIAVLWLDPEGRPEAARRPTQVDWAAVLQLVRHLQPRALVAGLGPDIRSLTAEAVIRRDEEGSVQPLGEEGWWYSLFPGTQRTWYPVERRASLRPSWFYRSREDGRLKTVAQLVELHRRSVGRDATLLLGVAIDPRGLLPDADVRRLSAFAAELKRYDGPSLGEVAGENTTLVLRLAPATRVNQVVLMEDITRGQRIRRYLLEAADGERWKVLQEGRFVGRKEILRFEPVTTEALRLRVIDSAATPCVRRLAAFFVD